MPANMSWPRKYDLFGVRISATTYDEAEQAIIQAARQRAAATVTHLPVAGVVSAAMNAAYRRQIDALDIVAPDGQPVRWALNRFHAAGLKDRCYGPEMMLRLCRRAAEERIGVYLYGSTPEVSRRLRANLLDRCPGLIIAGHESPPFRALSPEEDEAMVRRINESGAALVFVGLGCPKQDVFAYEHRHRIRAVQMCVGAAFDFLAGTKKMAPSWMQRSGLEWLFRLCQEPARLLDRYLRNNTIFMWLVARRMLFGR